MNIEVLIEAHKEISKVHHWSSHYGQCLCGFETKTAESLDDHIAEKRVEALIPLIAGGVSGAIANVRVEYGEDPAELREELYNIALNWKGE